MLLNLWTGVLCICIGKDNMFLILFSTPFSYLIIYVNVHVMNFFFLIVIDCWVKLIENALWIRCSSY